MIRAYVYVDGFNLYYGAIKRKTRGHWLNIAQLIENILPKELQKKLQVEKIKYFTARVSSRKYDPEASKRQQIYLSALKTLPLLEIYYGSFLPKLIWRPITGPPPEYSPLKKEKWQKAVKLLSGLNENAHVNTLVRVSTTEEKGSDVNLASHMLVDASENSFDIAIIISNDTDFITPIQMVVKRFNKKIYIISPRNRLNPRLEKYSTECYFIRKRHIMNSLFPDIINTAKKTITKPSNW